MNTCSRCSGSKPKFQWEMQTKQGTERIGLCSDCLAALVHKALNSGIITTRVLYRFVKGLPL